MKRFALVALLATLIFGVVSSASATELKVKGNFDVYGMWSANLRDFDSDVADADNYFTTQRMRTYFSFVASENLKAVLGLEIDNNWGDAGVKGSNAQWGSDGTNIEVKHAYLDFTFPDTAVNVKAGLQYVALPGIFGNPVFDDDAAALVVSAPITDMVTIAAGYTRGQDDDMNFQNVVGTDKDDVDMAFVAVPIALDGFSIAPYAAYAKAGANALVIPEDLTAWVVGANAELSMFDPLTISADLIYGGTDTTKALETEGWYAALAASYKFDMVTPTLFALYFSGNDDDATNGGEMLPQLAEGWGISPYVGGVRAFSTTYDTFSGLDNSLWAVGLVLDGMSFVENLSHQLTVAYVAGTTDSDAGAGFDEKDSAWEVYLVNKYMIYENLAAINELGYCTVDVDGVDTDASYFATVGFQYKF